MHIQLNNRTALVGGATQGIGKAVAMQLAACGATVCLIARNETQLAQVCKELPATAGQKHFFAVADYANTEQLRAALSGIASGHRIDIIVNNSGGPASGPALEAAPEAFLNAFTQHLIANQLVVKQFAGGMKEQHWGRIINIISTSVKIPLRNLGVSNTIRGAVASWSKTLANELGPFGITVNNILPGATSTDRLAQIISANALKKGVDEATVRAEMLHEIPAGRFGEAQEPAYAAAFLASDYASYINGINLPVDGGRTGSL